MGYPVMCLEYCIHLAEVKYFGTVTNDALSGGRRLNAEGSESHGILRTFEELWAFSGGKTEKYRQ